MSLEHGAERWHRSVVETLSGRGMGAPRPVRITATACGGCSSER